MSELLPKSTVRFSHIARKLPFDSVSSSLQRKEYAPIEIVLTEKKGYGLRAEEDLPKYVLSHSPTCALLTCYRDAFIYEYVGDVVNPISFKKRMREYGQEGIRHFYFMMLQKDEVSKLSI